MGLSKDKRALEAEAAQKRDIAEATKRQLEADAAKKAEADTKAERARRVAAQNAADQKLVEAARERDRQTKLANERSRQQRDGRDGKRR